MSSATHPALHTASGGEPALVVQCGAHGGNARAVRDLVRVAALLAGAGDETADDLRLAVGELFANCVTHVPGTTVRVTVAHDPATHRFTVIMDDTDNTPVPMPDHGRMPTGEAESGYGLGIVRRLTDVCGVIPHRHGKSVWLTTRV